MLVNIHTTYHNCSTIFTHVSMNLYEFSFFWSFCRNFKRATCIGYLRRAALDDNSLIQLSVLTIGYLCPFHIFSVKYFLFCINFKIIILLFIYLFPLDCLYRLYFSQTLSFLPVHPIFSKTNFVQFLPLSSNFFQSLTYRYSILLRHSIVFVRHSIAPNKPISVSSALNEPIVFVLKCSIASEFFGCSSSPPSFWDSKFEVNQIKISRFWFTCLCVVSIQSIVHIDGVMVVFA